MVQTWPLIGRERILEEIRVSLADGPVVLLGRMGVGKTRLARETADRLAGEGWDVETVTGSESARSIPFGAVSHLVPTLPSSDLFLILERASSLLRRLDGAAPLLYLVEDAHHLDPGSRALMERLVSEGSAQMLVTIRSSHLPDRFVTELLGNDATTTFEVPPLTEFETVQLLEEVFDAVPDPAFVESLWSLTEGNPLFLREIVEHARASGALVVDGNLTVRTALSPSLRLTELVWSRLAAATPAQRRVLDIIAVTEPAPLHLLAGLVDLEEVDRLVQGALLRVDPVADQEVVRSAHPLYGEIIRSGMTRERRKELAIMMADALVGGSELLPGSALMAAVWLLDADLEPDPRVALTAAREALAKGDPSLAERLGRSALGETGSVEALMVVGTALSVGGEFAEAGQILARAVELAGDDELADAALARARHLLWIERRFRDSMTVLEEALERVPVRDRPRLQVEQATQLAPQGAMERSLELLDGVVHDPITDEPTLLGALTWSTLIRVMLGRFDDLEPDLARADQLAEKHGDDIPLAQDQVGANRVMMALSQDVDEARRLTVEGQARCEERGGGILIWTVCRSWAEMSAGDIDAALRTTRRALDEADAFDPFGNRAMTWCTRALALALAGRAGEARSILEDLDEDSMEPRTRIWFDRARLRSLAAESLASIGGQDGQGVERAREAGLPIWAADLAFDLVRCGGRGSEVLEQLAAEVSANSMVPLYARAAVAVEQGEESAVLSVARELVDRGASLSAAEVVANVARRREGAAGARLATLCLDLLRSCPGAGPLPVGEVPDPLTKRESQVARMAARGSTSREIADVLYLSVRTVDNHLARVYRKLGLSGREELEPWFPMERV